jgi:hypothetical protein
MNSRLLLILSLLFLALRASADPKTGLGRPSQPKQYADTAIYQGMSIKLDIAMPILELARSAGKIQDYEMALNVRLAKRFYPTLELGYAIADVTADGGHYSGQGGFARVGMDLSTLKKGTSENCLMVGLRIAGAYQGFQVTNVPVYGDYWPMGKVDYLGQRKFDCWGEIVAGCQVHIWKGFQMGWYVRMKILLTRTDKQGDALPAYLPGFGYRDDTNWGINYFLGYKF